MIAPRLASSVKAEDCSPDRRAALDQPAIIEPPSPAGRHPDWMTSRGPRATPGSRVTRCGESIVLARLRWRTGRAPLGVQFRKPFVVACPRSGDARRKATYSVRRQGHQMLTTGYVPCLTWDDSAGGRPSACFRAVREPLPDRAFPSADRPHRGGRVAAPTPRSIRPRRPGRPRSREPRDRIRC